MLVHGMCDDVMRLVMQKLGLEVSPFKLQRRVKVSLVPASKPPLLRVEGIDSDGTPYSLFSKVSVQFGTTTHSHEKEPFDVPSAFNE